jgi:hypothetical protein
VLSVLGQVADPRKRRGLRHTLPVILGVVVCAVLAGARSFVAIAEWAADADDTTLADLGAGAVVPCESGLDPGEFAYSTVVGSARSPA